MFPNFRGGGYDIASPDAHANGQLAAGATESIAVTQKPRLIVCTMNRTSGGTTQYYTWVVDVEHNKAVQYQNGNNPIDYSSNISTRFPTISDSQVVIKNYNSGGAVQHMTLIYY